VTFNVALRAQVVVGLKVTLMVQLAPAANELEHVWVCPKSPASVPAIAMLVIVIAVVPTFLSVTVLTALVVPTFTEPKLRLVGVSSAVVPVPLSGTCCGLPAALSVTARFALRAPVVDGLNVRLTVQLAAAASLLPQVVAVSGKSAASAPVTAILLMVSAVLPTLVSVTLGVLRYFIGQKLQSDEPVQGQVLGLIDHPHAAATQLLDNAVMRDYLVDHGGAGLRLQY